MMAQQQVNEQLDRILRDPVTMDAEFAERVGDYEVDSFEDIVEDEIENYMLSRALNEPEVREMLEQLNKQGGDA